MRFIFSVETAMLKSRCFIFLLCLFFLTIFQLGFSEQWTRVYLATYPRSGNHWIRYLVEEASHIATSSVYRDPDPLHLKRIFPWGGYCCHHGYEGQCRYPTKKDCVLVKTHFPAQEQKVSRFD